MNRIDFEDQNYELNLMRNWDGEYAYPETRERFKGWTQAIEAERAAVKWKRKRMIFKAGKVLVMVAVASVVVVELYVMAHFAFKYW